MKIKTKSSVKKRFFVTSYGKIKSTQANKQHNMRKRSKRQIKNQRGTIMLSNIEKKRITLYLSYKY